MKLTITIDTDSAAFEDLGMQDQLEHIFNQIIDKLSYTQLEVGDTMKLKDFNGNNVGTLDTV